MANTKTYVTFGQAHYHVIGDNVFNADCVAVIHHTTEEDGRALAFQFFGQKFCFEYPDGVFQKHVAMHFFPRGLIDVNEPLEETGDMDPMIDGVVPTPATDEEREGFANLYKNSDGKLCTDGNI